MAYRLQILRNQLQRAKDREASLDAQIGRLMSARVEAEERQARLMDRIAQLEGRS